MKRFFYLYLTFITMFFWKCKPGSEPDASENFSYTNVKVGEVSGKHRYNEVSLEPKIIIDFSHPINTSNLSQFFSLKSALKEYPLLFKIINGGMTLEITSAQRLGQLTKYEFNVLPSLSSARGTVMHTPIKIELYTGVSLEDQFERISDEELLTLVQKQTFKYFWDFGHPVSGMARERNTSGDLVTSGGTGFGVMAILVAIERGFITRQEGFDRIMKIVSFLSKADRFHGAFPHWLNGSTGKTIAFSQKDDGADLVETSLLIQGLLTARAYFSTDTEVLLRENITKIWESVEWSWFARERNVLYWHWSPNFGWEMNHPILGWNECLITYVLAASSPTFPISKSVYEGGYTQSSTYKNGNNYFGIKLPLGEAVGGPLFFSHYSFLGLNPLGLKDSYVSYEEQVRNHTLINQAYCKSNPKGYIGYSDDCWGLTASDNHLGYSAHSPTNDLGVITPSAALSSIPFASAASMKALHFFYYKLGDKIWGEYGFKDAFNLTEVWFANTYLAIDQGPIICMIENHRSKLLWTQFMKDKDVQSGLTKLGFTY